MKFTQSRFWTRWVLGERYFNIIDASYKVGVVNPTRVKRIEVAWMSRGRKLISRFITGNMDIDLEAMRRRIELYKKMCKEDYEKQGSGKIYYDELEEFLDNLGSRL